MQRPLPSRDSVGKMRTPSTSVGGMRFRVQKFSVPATGSEVTADAPCGQTTVRWGVSVFPWICSLTLAFVPQLATEQQTVRWGVSVFPWICTLTLALVPQFATEQQTVRWSVSIFSWIYSLAFTLVPQLATEQQTVRWGVSIFSWIYSLTFSLVKYRKVRSHY